MTEVAPPPMRQRLTAAAARVAATSGVGSLTARRVSAEAGTSTMAVYSHFGSMEALLAAVVDEGFQRLERHLAAVEPTDDPLADVVRQTRAYLDHARANPQLYAVMFGLSGFGSGRPRTVDELRVGRRETLDRIGANLARAAADGRLRGAGGSALVFRWWTFVHGYATLETVGFIGRENGSERVLEPLLVDFFVGEGDEPRRAQASVSAGFS